MDIQIIILSLVGFFIVVLIVLAILILLKISKPQKDDGRLKLLQDFILDLNKTVDTKITETNRFLDTKLTETHKNLDTKLSEANKYLSDNMNKTFATSTKINEEANKRIEEITKKLTELGETNKQIQDIWGQLRGLENVLKNPKQRWNLWEYFLKELLENVFTTEQYSLQYAMDGIWIVDAALFIGGKTIPIDSKFPHENYERLIASEDDVSIKKYSTELKKDINKRIDETSKYIQPHGETTDFAFMLIPAEWMYYDLFINKVGDINAKALIEYAFKKKVIICSPSGFYAYLQTVIQGMRALQIEEQAKDIQKNVIKLQEDLTRFEERFSKMWNSLGTVVRHYNDSSKSFKKIDKNVYKLTEGKAGGNLDIPEIEKPLWE